MTNTSVIDRTAEQTELEPDPSLAVTVDLAPGMRVWADKHVGDVPMMGVITGRAYLVVSIGVGQVRDLDAEHVAVAEEFAAAACAFRDELRELVAARQPDG